jgi:hypothetical protein
VRHGKRTLLFSCNRLDRLPLLQSQPAVHLLKQIDIRYPENADDLIRSLSHIHTEDKELLPCLIAIDDVDSFVVQKHGHEQVAVLAKILSYSVDTAEFISKATAVDGQNRNIECNLIVSTASASPGIVCNCSCSTSFWLFNTVHIFILVLFYSFMLSFVC